MLTPADRTTLQAAARAVLLSHHGTLADQLARRPPEPLAPLPTSGDRPEIPVCRYVVIGAGGEVVAAGSTAEVLQSRLVIRPGRLKPGVYTVLLALALGDNWVNPEVTVTKYRVDPGP